MHRQQLQGEDAIARRLLTHPAIRLLGNGGAPLLVAPAFLNPIACEELVALIEADLRPSTLVDPNGDDAFRTSRTCDLDPAAPVVEHIRRAVCALMGIAEARAEPMQGQRYGIGDQFKLHGDYFRPGSDDYARHCGTSGQRTWTAMAYLDAPEAGGATAFPGLGVRIRPEAGTLLMWNNLLADGSGNAATMHHAEPVMAGLKTVITLWFRERDYG